MNNRPKRVKIVGIYEIRCTANNKVSIGCSRDTHARMGTHLSRLKTNTLSENQELRKDALKYGADTFTARVIEFLPDTISNEELYEREKYHTEMAHKNGLCYNPIRPLPFNGFGKIVSCSICGKPHYARYMCNNHYNQWLRIKDIITAEQFIHNNIAEARS